jgi:uncharacterized protein YgiM (DUF1202 family)
MHSPHRTISPQRTVSAVRGIAFAFAVFEFAVFALLDVPLHAAGRFPYTAQVVSAGAQFRAGPGESYYPTSDAREGDAVEVYHEDGAWSAIRPAAGSHSWVSAKVLKLPSTLRFQAGVDLASPVPVEVGVANAPAFIGSEISPDRDAVAVRLNAGERVYVLSAEPTEGQTWIKIAPPSGEFRWIETKHLKAKPTDSLAKSSSDVEAATAADATTANVIDAAANAILAAAEETQTESSVIKEVPAVPNVAVPNLAAAKQPASKPTAKKPSASPNPARGFWTQLQALELELSMMVAREPKTWRFDDIRRDAQNLYDSSAADEEFDAARHLLAKLAQFESVRRERVDLDTRQKIPPANATANPPTTANSTANAASNAANPARPRTSLASPPTAPSAAATPNAPTASPTISDGRYDASGRLVALPSRRVGAPSYAIVDERNNVRQYVSPAPNVNLQPYVGRTVGITGVAGPSPDSTRTHVMAKRIDVLDAPIRR